MFDYKTKCEELIKDCVDLKRENEQLRRDNKWIRSVLAYALMNSPALVVREEELANAPEIELSENLANELIIRIRRK